jgi:DNA-binding transcriptional LysR family regulator
MNDLNSLWLKSFTVLCEERHFTRAAARLNMTQPGMSQHIAKLEQKLGVALIERDAPGFALTDAGEKTLAMARARWREERDFLESLDDEDEDRGKISAASSSSFAMLLYPALIQWMADAPGISASLTAAPEDSIVAGVLSGSYDVGVIANAPR